MARVRILMATRDGARHLPEQLASFLAQGHGDWELWASDDGSTDGTPELLRDWGARHPGRLGRLLKGPGRGSAANFLSLLAHPDLAPGPVALADQDDLWLPHRLGRALALLGAEGGPAGYAGRTTLADEGLRPLGPSWMPPRGAHFGNALLQNVLAGNTIALDAGGLALLRASVPAALAGEGVPHHDWWAYLVLTGAGARVVLDGEPLLLYRQHGRNALGAHRGGRAALARLGALGDGTYGGWLRRNLAALGRAEGLLTAEARARAEALGGLWAGPALARAGALRRAGAWRQSRAQTALVGALAALGRL